MTPGPHGRRAAAVLAVLATTLGVCASVRAQAPAHAPPGAAALAAWWDAHHVPLPPAPLVTHADVERLVRQATLDAPDLFSSEVIGQSVEGRSLHHVWFGRGATHLLLWSQMHGDEPTATSALFDLLEWVRRERTAPVVARLLDRLTVHLVPMLNPDGAQRFRRRNAQNIDINRDALRLQTPEGRALKALRDRVQPVLGFNLHNQSWQTSVGTTPPRPASLSLLAVAHDPERTDSPRRVLAKKTAAIIRDAVEALLPERIGRYSDEFEARAFGDNIARWGTGVVLIETGPLEGRGADAALVRLNFVAIVTALDALASGRVERADPARYESLPLNGSRLLHTKIVNAIVHAGTGVEPYTADIGITVTRSVREREGRREILLVPRIDDLGDLRVLGALDTIDATGLVAAPLVPPEPRPGDVISLPAASSGNGNTLEPGQPGTVLLLEPAGANRYRIVRIVRPES